MDVMTSTTNPILDSALSYVRRGWRVLPTSGKVPATHHGVKDATCDEQCVLSWFTRFPDYNVGIATGPDSGVFVVDVDPRNGGMWTPPVETLAAHTGSGGMHYFFRWPDGVKRLRKKLEQGVDIQGSDQFVVAPPSKTAGEYIWVNNLPIADAPNELLSRIVLVDAETARPGDRYNATHTWEDVLVPLGWRVHSKGTDNQTYWTRPGKDDGISASTNYMDSDLLYVWSTNTGFEQDKGYSKFAVYAEILHGGDFSAAAKALAAEIPIRQSVEPLFRIETPQRTALFIEAVKPDHIISEYIAYGRLITDAADEFHEAAALALLSTITAGMRVQLASYPGGLATNLYLVLVGDSSVSRKSTVQGIAKHILGQLRPNALIPDRMTGEAAIHELSQRTAALWMPDEFGMLLQQIYHRDFLRPLEELMLTLYSGQTYEYTTVRGSQRITNLHLGVFGAATPVSIAGAGTRTIGSGLLPRFGIVFPERPTIILPPKSLTEEIEAKQKKLVERLRAILYKVSSPNAATRVTLSQEALDILSPVDSLYGHNTLTARMSTTAYKVAALVAIGDDRTHVTREDADAAVRIIGRWAAGANRLRGHMGRPAADIAFLETIDIARQALHKLQGLRHENGFTVIPLTVIARTLNMELRTINRIRETLVATGEVQVSRATTEAEELWYVRRAV